MENCFGYCVVNFGVYEYFGVGPEIQEEATDIFPRFLRWLPKHHLSLPSRCSLELWHLVIDNLTIDDVSSFFLLILNLQGLVMIQSLLFLSFFVTFQLNLNPWAGYEGYAKCEQAIELNGHQVLFECGHGKYRYLGDRVLPQVEHVYPPATIPTHPCHTIRLADLLVDEEIARARDGYIIAKAEGNYFKIVRDHLQGCLVGRTVFLFSSEVKFFICPFFLHISAW